MKVRKRMVAHIKSKVVVVGGGGQLSFRWLISDEANPSCNKKTKESVEMKKKFNPQAGIEFTTFHLPDGCLTVGLGRPSRQYTGH